MSHQKIGLWPRHDRAKGAHVNLRRLALLAGILVIPLGAVLFIQACDRIEATKEGEKMSLARTSSVPSVVRPPIDASAPVTMERATFALG